MSADLKLEIDPIMGKDTATGNSNTKYFDFGADQTNVIEVKNAFLQAKRVFNLVDFKGGVFGYTIPGRIMIADDVPGFELTSQIGRFSVDGSILKVREGNTGTGVTDSYFFNLWAMTDTAVRLSKTRPGGILKIQPIFSVAAAKDFDKVAYIPQLYLETKYGPLSMNFIGAYALGSDKTGASDIDFSSFGAKLESTITLKPAYVKAFGVFFTGDKDTGDDKNKNFGDSFLIPGIDIQVTNYFYEGGLEQFNVGSGEKLYTSGYGVVSFGGGIGRQFNNNNTLVEAVAAYHMAAAEPTGAAEKGYGLEVNLNAKQKISKNGLLEGEVDLFVPGKYYTGDKRDVAVTIDAFTGIIIHAVFLPKKFLLRSAYRRRNILRHISRYGQPLEMHSRAIFIFTTI